MGKPEKHEKKSKKKHKHKTHKSKRKREKSKQGAKDSLLDDDQSTKEEPKPVPVDINSGGDASNGFEIPIDLMNNKSHVPVTPEEYQRRQRHIRRVVDPSTGRTRLIRGDGEVLEEIVTKERHVEINKAATANDGHFFQDHTVRARVQERRK